MGKVKINGIDIETAYGAYVTAFPQSPSPVAEIRHSFFQPSGLPVPINHSQEFSPRRISIAGNIGKTSQSNIESIIELLAGLVGYGNRSIKESILELVNSDSDGTDSGSSIIMRVLLEDFRSDYIEPVHIQEGRNFEIVFRVLETISASGITELSYTLNDASAINRLYFTDSNALQGSSNVKVTITDDGNALGWTPQLYALAINDKLTNRFGTAVSGGTHPSVSGAFGTPAIDFTNSGQSLKYSTYPNLAPCTDGQFAIAIRFKRNFSVNDGLKHYLFQEPTGSFEIYFDSDSLSQLTINSSKLSSPIRVNNGSASLTTAWNLLLVSVFGNGSVGKIYAWFANNTTADMPTATTTTGLFAAPNAYFWIGSNSSGTQQAKCHIDEVAIYKYPIIIGDGLSGSEDDFKAGVFNFNQPIIQTPNLEMNRRLTFYLDFTNGFQAKSNEHGFLQRSADIQDESIIWDTDTRKATLIDINTFSKSDDVANLAVLSNYGILFPEISQYNKFLIYNSGVGSGTQSAVITYLPRRRM